MNQSTLMHKVLVGQASESEVAELERWLSLDPANATEFEELKLLYWDSWKADKSNDGTSDSSWTKIENAIHRIQARKKYFSYLKVAAVATGIYAIMALGYVVTSSGTNNPLGKVRGDLLTHTVHYKDTPIGKVMTTIQENCDLKIMLASTELAECKFTGSFKGGTSIREVIETVAKAKDLKVNYTAEQTVVLSGSHCKM